MAIARIEEFIANLEPLTKISEIEILCNQELDYLRRELGIKVKFSEHGYPIGVEGDARRLKTQVSAYRNAIKSLPTNSKNSISRIKQGRKLNQHKALKYFNLADYEKQNVNTRDRDRHLAFVSEFWLYLIAIEFPPKAKPTLVPSKK